MKASSFHHKPLRQFVQRIATGALSVVVGTWFAAWLGQLDAFKNPGGLVAALIEFLSWLITERWFIALSGAVFGFAAGVWLDAYMVRRARQRWWEGLHTLTVKSFSCLVAGIPEASYETSARATAVANEILSYINSGHTGVALEMPLYPAGIGPRYAPKSVGPEAIVFKKDLERLAPSRGWSLPWPIEPSQPAVVARPAAVDQAMLGSRLLNALYGNRDEQGK